MVCPCVALTHAHMNAPSSALSTPHHAPPCVDFEMYSKLEHPVWTIALIIVEHEKLARLQNSYEKSNKNECFFVFSRHNLAVCCDVDDGGGM